VATVASGLNITPITIIIIIIIIIINDISGDEELGGEIK
jgi:hypothetical protein